MPAWYSNAMLSKRCRVTAMTGPLALLLSTLAAAQTDRLGGSQGGSLFDEQPRFLPVDEAFSYHLSLDSGQQVSIHWDVAEGYYLYREQFDFQLTTADAGPIVVHLPDGTPHHDAYFGDVEVYYGALRVRLTLPDDTPTDQALSLRLRFQGCAEAGLCYPPESREIKIPARQRDQ